MKKDLLSDKKISKSAGLLAILCAVVYFSAYVGRLSYSANISMACDFFSVNNGTAGIAGTCLFVSYGVGQVVNGLLCKKYNPKYAIFIALILSAIMNVSVGLTPSDKFYLVCVFWFVNGCAQSVLWSSIIRLLNRSLAVSYLRTAVLIMSMPVALGTFTSYGISALFSALKLSFKWVFFIASVIMTIVAVVWFASVEKLKEKCKLERLQIDGEDQTVENQSAKAGKKKFPAGFLSVFVMLAIFAVVNNFVKDGANTWMPKILQDKYKLGEALSVFITLFLPLSAVFGSMLALFLHKILKSYVSVCGALYGICVLLIGLVVLFLNMPLWIITVICFVLVAVSMSAVNNVITNIFPMTYTSKMNAGLIAGLLDAFCYVGSAITTFGLGSVSDVWGWNAVFYLLLGLCALMTLVAIIFTVVDKKCKKN